MGKGAPNAAGTDDSAAAAVKTAPPATDTAATATAPVEAKPAAKPVEKTTATSTHSTSHASAPSHPKHQHQSPPKSHPVSNISGGGGGGSHQSSRKPHTVSPSATVPHRPAASTQAADAPAAITDGSAVVNGHAGQANNGNGANRRVPKSKWVPLEIDLPKARGGKPPRERNNNVSGTTTTTSTGGPIKRRDPDADVEYYASEREHREPREPREQREPRESRDSRDSRNSRPYRAPTYRGGGSASRTRAPIHSTSTRTSHPHSTAPSTRPSGTPSSTVGGGGAHVKRAAPIRTSTSGGGGGSGGGSIQKARPPRTISHHHQHQNGEFATAEFPVDFSLVKKIVSSGATAAGIDGAPQFLMPYLGTYYYNGVPSYANMDTSSLKEAIRKQV